MPLRGRWTLRRGLLALLLVGLSQCTTPKSPSDAADDAGTEEHSQRAHTQLCDAYFSMSRPLAAATAISRAFFGRVYEDCRLRAILVGLDGPAETAYGQQLVAFTLWLMDCDTLDDEYLDAPVGSFAPGFPVRKEVLSDADVELLQEVYMESLRAEIPLTDADARLVRRVVSSAAGHLQTCAACPSRLDQCVSEG